MKILALSTSDLTGGAERVFARLLSRLSEHGCAIRMLSSEAPAVRQLYAESPGIEMLPAAAFRRRSEAGLPEYVASLARGNAQVLRSARGYDAVIINNLQPLPYAQLMLALAGMPTLLINHNSSLSPIDHKIVRMCLKPATMVHVSNAARGLFPNAKPSRARVIYNGLPQQSHDSRRTPDFGGKIHLATVSRITPLKGIEDAIDSVRWLFDHAPDLRERITLTICGAPHSDEDARYLEALQQRVVSIDLGSSVKFAGQVAAPKFLKSVDCLIHVSREADSLPTAILEGMNAGCIVIASDLGGQPEIINNAENGYIVPAGNVNPLAERLLDMSKPPTAPELKRIVKNAYSTLQTQFDEDRQIASYLDILKSMVHKKE